MRISTIDSDQLAGVMGGQTPGQIDQRQAVQAGADGARSGAQTGATIGNAAGRVLAPPGFGDTGAAIGEGVGRVGGTVVGGVRGYVNDVGRQIRGWFGR